MKVLFGTEMENIVSTETAADLPNKSDSIPDIIIDHVGDCDQNAIPPDTVLLTEEVVQNAKNSGVDTNMKQEAVVPIPNGTCIEDSRNKSTKSEGKYELQQKTNPEASNSAAKDDDATCEITDFPEKQEANPLPEIVIEAPKEDLPKLKPRYVERQYNAYQIYINSF